MSGFYFLNRCYRFHCNHFSRVKCIVIDRCFVFDFKQSNLAYIFKNMFCL